MNAKKFFLDTNIIAYTFDKAAAKKQAIAQQLLEQAIKKEGVISYQVIQEFMNLALKKFKPPMSDIQAKHYLEEVLLPICDYYPVDAFYQRGLDIQSRWKFSWYDSLIVAAALESDCDVLYTEDLQHAQNIETLTIWNPFWAVWVNK